MFKFISPLPASLNSDVHDALFYSPLECDALPVELMTRSRRYALALAAHMPIVFEDGPDEFINLTDDDPYCLQNYYDDLKTICPKEYPIEVYCPLELRFKFDATVHPLADVIPHWIELPVGDHFLLRWNVFDEKIFVTSMLETLDDGVFPTDSELKELRKALGEVKKIKGQSHFNDGTKLVTQEAVSAKELDVPQLRAVRDLYTEFSNQMKSIESGSINVQTKIIGIENEIIPTVIDFELKNLRVTAWMYQGQLTVQATRYEIHKSRNGKFIDESETTISSDEAYDLLEMLQSYDFNGMWIDADSVVNALEEHLQELSFLDDLSSFDTD